MAIKRQVVVRIYGNSGSKGYTRVRYTFKNPKKAELVAVELRKEIGNRGQVYTKNVG